MNTDAVNFKLYPYWLSPDNNNEESARLKSLHLDCLSNLNQRTYACVKILCSLSEPGAPQTILWRVRVIKIELINSRTTNVSLSSSNNSNKNKSLPELLESIENTHTFIKENKLRLMLFERLTGKLNRLILCILNTKKWPFGSFEPSINTIIKVFQSFTNHPPTLSNQNAFFKFVGELKKKLHLSTITLEEIGTKIVTKAERSSPFGKTLYEKVQDWSQIGVDKIFLEKAPKEVLSFLWIFAHYAYMYKVDSDSLKSNQNLKKTLERMVEVVIAYDNDKNNNSNILCDFTAKLLTNLQSHFEKKNCIQAKWVFSLIWTFEILVENNAYIEHMQTQERMGNIDIANACKYLINQDTCWKGISEYIIFLGSRRRFNEVIIDKKSFDDEQLFTLFFHLNHQYKTANAIFKPSFKKMYFTFLEKLARENNLHYLISYASKEKHKLTLTQNLQDLGYSFMSDLPVETFFSNGSFTAIKNKPYPPSIETSRTLVKLFSGSPETVVTNNDSFNKAIGKLTEDFQGKFHLFCETALSKIGELSRAGTKEPAEVWLENYVSPLYVNIKLLAIRCLPLQWNKIQLDERKNLKNKLSLHEGKLYLIDSDNNPLQLKELYNVNSLNFEERSFHVTETLRGVEAKVEDLFKHVENREGLSKLTEAFLMFYQNGTTKHEVDPLLNIIFDNMIKESSLTFNQRMTLLADFLNGISPFFKRLHKLIEGRFFNQTILKDNLAKNLVDLTGNKAIIGTNLNPYLSSSKPKTPILKNDNVIQDLVTLVASLCSQDLKVILNKSTLSELNKISSQFEYVINRRFDEVSYPKQDFIDTFCAHSVNKDHLPADTNLKTIIGTLPCKEKIIADYKDLLNQRPIPVHFILPNQALAIHLCVCEEFKDRNLLIKLGTGQGKSLVIALAALNEAKKLKTDSNGLVYVFTSYDHLAKRDHELGENFFKKEGISSLCISTINDIEKFSDSIKIIYADIENIDTITQNITFKLLTNKATQNEILFLKKIYSNKDQTRIILDEYDLLLRDLEDKTPFVKTLPNTFLDVSFAKQSNNKILWPNLVSHTDSSNTSGTQKAAVDESSGREYTSLDGLYSKGSQCFNLLISVMRLSRLIKKATRVIGLSGTALRDQQANLDLNPLYFELPSSQNPKIFETKFEKQVGEIPPELPDKINSIESAYIACHQTTTFPFPQKSGDHFILSETEVNRYTDAIIKDISKSQQGSSYKRPVLIFADPLFVYKTAASDSKTIRLWDTLKKALTEAKLSLKEFQGNVTDSDLQTIALAGMVTLTTIKYGRGADIRVNLDIEEGLHVIIARPVIHDRLLAQLIGRTGRMGRKGSYSAITFGELISNKSQQARQANPFYHALHELTGLFIEKISSQPYDASFCKRWTLFFGGLFEQQNQTEPKINKEHAKIFCNNVTDNTVISPYLK